MSGQSLLFRLIYFARLTVRTQTECFIHFLTRQKNVNSMMSKFQTKNNKPGSNKFLINARHKIVEKKTEYLKLTL